MVAGDFGLAFELLEEVEREVRARIVAQPQNWWLVRDVATSGVPCIFAADGRRPKRRSCRRWGSRWKPS
jgi:hypothetical protein